MSGQLPDDPRRRIYERLTDPSRKSARGPHRYAYTEEQFDRKLADEGSLPLLDNASAHTPLLNGELIRGQAEELLQNLGLSPRQMQICRLRLEGYTAGEIAAAFGLSERRVRSLLKELREILELRLTGRSGDEIPGSDPYYGWQEVYLDTQKRGAG